MIKASYEFNHLGFIWGIIRKQVSDKVHQGIRGMKQFKTMNGAVFDVAEEQSAEFEELLKKDRFFGVNYTLEKATGVLPDLIDVDYSRGVNNNYNTQRPSNNGSSNGNGHSGEFSNGHSNGSHKPLRTGNRKDIFIGNLSFETNDSDLKTFFSQNDISAGNFEVRVALDKETGKSKGFGFVSVYEDDVLFEKFLKLNGRKLKDRSLRINNANK